MTSVSDAQSDTSAGGTVWECLVVWYLNLCLAGTRAVVVKKKSHLPQSLTNALNVIISGGSSLTEPDVLMIHLDNNELDAQLGSTRSEVEEFGQIVDANFTDTSAVNIQCKTNWNDCVIQPMLWNLLYGAARNLRNSGSTATLPLLGAQSITFGHSGHYIKGLKGFAYAFATVPTNLKAANKFKSTHAPVVRARSFSGGYYWGKETIHHICPSIKEFFNVNAGLLPMGLTPGDGYSRKDPNIDLQAFQLV